MRSQALKEAQIRYKNNNRKKINDYHKQYEKEHYDEAKIDKKKKYYLANKERIKQRTFEDRVFTGFRVLMKTDYR